MGGLTLCAAHWPEILIYQSGVQKLEELFCPGPCFLKVPKNFHTQKAMAKSQTLWLQNFFIPIFLEWTYELKMALQAQKVSGAFMKWAPDINVC